MKVPLHQAHPPLQVADVITGLEHAAGQLPLCTRDSMLMAVAVQKLAPAMQQILPVINQGCDPMRILFASLIQAELLTLKTIAAAPPANPQAQEGH